MRGRKKERKGMKEEMQKEKGKNLDFSPLLFSFYFSISYLQLRCQLKIVISPAIDWFMYLRIVSVSLYFACRYISFVTAASTVLS